MSRDIVLRTMSSEYELQIVQAVQAEIVKTWNFTRPDPFYRWTVCTLNRAFIVSPGVLTDLSRFCRLLRKDHAQSAAAPLS
jgi:hypothetical protein